MTSLSIVRHSLTAFVNIKIKLTISFRGVHKNKMYIYVFIEINTHICISIDVTKKRRLRLFQKKQRWKMEDPTWHTKILFTYGKARNHSLHWIDPIPIPARRSFSHPPPYKTSNSVWRARPRRRRRSRHRSRLR
jgi:hypothetical protein